MPTIQYNNDEDLVPKLTSVLKKKGFLVVKNEGWVTLRQIRRLLNIRNPSLITNKMNKPQCPTVPKRLSKKKRTLAVIPTPEFLEYLAHKDNHGPITYSTT